MDGAAAPYACREIRQQGRGALTAEECWEVCPLARTMAETHAAWRAELAAVSLADILGEPPSGAPVRTRRLLIG